MEFFINLIPMVVFGFACTSLSLLTNRKFGHCVPAGFMLAAMLTYVSQLLFHTFTFGFACIITLAAAALPLGLLRKQRFSELIFSNGLYAFVSICLLYAIIDFGRHFVIFDELYFWGKMVKESLRLDAFYSVPASTLGIHKDYPPFACMLELIWIKLCGGIYTEGRVSMAVHVFQLSLLVTPFAERISVRPTRVVKLLTFVLVDLAILSVILCLDPWGDRVATSILMDTVLPSMFAYGALVVLHQDGRLSLSDSAMLGLLCASMVMVKQVGIVFAGLLTLLAFIHPFTKSDDLHMKTAWKSALVALLFILALSACAYLSWHLYVKSLGLSGQFNLSIDGILTALSEAVSKSGSLRHDTLKNYILALFTKNIGTVSWLPITYASAAILIFTAILIEAVRMPGTIGRRQAIALGIVFGLGTVGYATMMGLLYLTSFNADEMRQLASFERYMASYVLGETLILLFIALEHSDIHSHLFERVRCIALLAALLLTMLSPQNMLYLIPQSLRGNRYASCEQDANWLMHNTDEGSSIYVIYDKTVRTGWPGKYQYSLIYFLTDRTVSLAYPDSFSILSDNTATTKIADAVKVNDYLYVRDTDEAVDTFIEAHVSAGRSSDENVNPDRGTLYRISSINGEMRLEEVAR